MSWYDVYIEPGIREQVELLRTNGFNTECSCEHEMYVQCTLTVDGEMKRLHDLLYNNGYRNYEINTKIKVDDGHLFTTTDIKF